MGFPFLKAASESREAIKVFLEQFRAELRVAMQLAGAANVAELQRAPVLVLGESRSWLELRGFGEVLHAQAQRGM